MFNFIHIFFSLFILLFAKESKIGSNQNIEVFISVLGNVQDAGSPQAGCNKDCCKKLFLHPDAERKIVSLGLIDIQDKKSWLFEASPDITTQLKTLKNVSQSVNETPDGIFLTHAHIGHYTGLMYLGREAMNTKEMPVYAMPKMKTFLESNGPWIQLVQLKNIKLEPMQNETEIAISNNIGITPFLVPHRDEFSETVGYLIKGPNKSALFIPDIDKWGKWNKQISEEIKKVDYALIDGTFYNGNEMRGRKMSEIPHPLVIESKVLFDNLPVVEKNKIYFIHFNHTNPLLDKNSATSKYLIKQGYHIARFGDQLGL